jgi:hypothetical protein
MASFPFWSQGFEWDTLYIGGVALPGGWRIEGAKSRDTDKVKAPDQDGYTLTNKGYAGGTIKAIGQLWAQEQLDDFWAIANDIDPEFVTQSTPYDIYHPASEMLWVTSVYVKQMAVAGPVKGVFTITLDLEQWMPETKVAPTKNSNKAKAPTKAAGFDGASTGGPPLSPEDFQLGLPTL